MDRLFLRFFLHLLGALVLGGVVLSVVVVPGIRSNMGRNVENALAPPTALVAALLAEELAAGADVEVTLARATRSAPAPVALVARAGLPLSANELARLDRGEVVRVGEPPRSTVYAPIAGATKILRLGPVGTPRPLNEWRVALMLLPFLIALVLGVYALLRPVRRALAGLADAAQAFGEGHLEVRAEVHAPDAFGRVAATFNGMAERIQELVAAQEELLHMTSHELRTPIQRLHFTLERLREAEDQVARERAVSRMESDLDEMDELIEELLTYVRIKERRPEVRATIDLRPLVDEVCETLVDIDAVPTLHGPPPGGAPLLVTVEARLVRRALSNLIVNALRHGRTQARVSVERQGQAVRIHVDDDGPGVAPEDRERIFDHFLRLDDERTQESRGFGLGLAIVRRIAEVHNGSATAMVSPLGGARFRLAFPLADIGDPDSKTARSAPAPARPIARTTH
jgi:two-component system sensor histidine kinase RstB